MMKKKERETALRHRRRVGAGLAVGEHLLREAQQHIAAQRLRPRLAPKVEALVGVVVAIVELAPFDAIIERQTMALGDEAAHARARRQADAETLALLLDQHLFIGRGAALDQRQQVLALDAVEALHLRALEDRRREIDRAGESAAALRGRA